MLSYPRTGGEAEAQTRVPTAHLQFQVQVVLRSDIQRASKGGRAAGQQRGQLWPLVMRLMSFHLKTQAIGLWNGPAASTTKGGGT
jgi:hypothetical protein